MPPKARPSSSRVRPDGMVSERCVKARGAASATPPAKAAASAAPGPGKGKGKGKKGKQSNVAESGKKGKEKKGKEKKGNVAKGSVAAFLPGARLLPPTGDLRLDFFNDPADTKAYRWSGGDVGGDGKAFGGEGRCARKLFDTCTYRSYSFVNTYL